VTTYPRTCSSLGSRKLVVESGMTPQQEIRAKALTAAYVPADKIVEMVLGVARTFAVWIEHGDDAPDREQP